MSVIDANENDDTDYEVNKDLDTRVLFWRPRLMSAEDEHSLDKLDHRSALDHIVLERGLQ